MAGREESSLTPHMRDSNLFKVVGLISSKGKTDYGRRKIGQLLNMSPKTVRGALDMAERKGWLSKEDIGGNRFVKSLTDLGKKELKYYRTNHRPREEDQEIMDGHARLLVALLRGELSTSELRKKLGIPTTTLQSRIDRCRSLKLIHCEFVGAQHKRISKLTPAGREIARKYQAGKRWGEKKISNPHGLLGVDRDVKKCPEWTHGVVYEDVKVRREIPKFIPHAQVLPFKGKDSLAE